MAVVVARNHHFSVPYTQSACTFSHVRKAAMAAVCGRDFKRVSQ